MRLAKARYEVPQVDDVDRLIAALCDVPLDRWYAAALAVASDPKREPAEQALDLALRNANPILLWNAHDDLDTALYRVTSPTSQSPMPMSKKNLIRATTRRAVAALVCAPMLEEAQLLTLTAPFIELIGQDEVDA